jgi:large subunit ribosomal protein L15
VINVDDLNGFTDGATIELASVLEKGLTSRVSDLFKVLGNGKLERKLTVRAQKFTKSAIEKIQALGGTVVVLDDQGREQAADAAAAQA